MAFASRKDDEGVWRLCQRMGKTFTHLTHHWSVPLEIRFKSQAQAKACADELNEKVWPAYEASRPERKRNRQPSPFNEAVEIIRRHGGLPDWEQNYE